MVKKKVLVLKSTSFKIRMYAVINILFRNMLVYISIILLRSYNITQVRTFSPKTMFNIVSKLTIYRYTCSFLPVRWRLTSGFKVGTLTYTVQFNWS